MSELPGSGRVVCSADPLQVAEMGAKRAVESGRYVLDLTLGFQRLALEEMARASDEVLERLKAEIDIASEFVARLASAHSVREIAESCNDCGHHQADAFLRDSEILFKCSRRMCEGTSRLMASTRLPVN